MYKQLKKNVIFMKEDTGNIEESNENFRIKKSSLGMAVKRSRKEK